MIETKGSPCVSGVGREPERHVASLDEGPIVGSPVLDPVLRLARGMDLGLHPVSLVDWCHSPKGSTNTGLSGVSDWQIRAPTPRLGSGLEGHLR